RSNCINWGILPFTLPEGAEFPYEEGDFIFIPDVRAKIAAGETDFPAKVLSKDGSVKDILLQIIGLTDEEKTIILDGCLINYYAEQNRR
ncbi:MAG: hydratase, partial [Lachnospiraceae bacterium]|nr:hydratase [Lachnospiraceae bacterium]